jgi:hypothetical protein
LTDIRKQRADAKNLNLLSKELVLKQKPDPHSIPRDPNQPNQLAVAISQAHHSKNKKQEHETPSSQKICRKTAERGVPASSKRKPRSTVNLADLVARPSEAKRFQWRTTLTIFKKTPTSAASIPTRVASRNFAPISLHDRDGRRYTGGFGKPESEEGF